MCPCRPPCLSPSIYRHPSSPWPQLTVVPTEPVKADAATTQAKRKYTTPCFLPLYLPYVARASCQHDSPAATTDEATANPKPATSNVPLGPPPRPTTTTGDTPDYFNTYVIPTIRSTHRILSPSPSSTVPMSSAMMDAASQDTLGSWPLLLLFLLLLLLLLLLLHELCIMAHSGLG